MVRVHWVDEIRCDSVNEILANVSPASFAVSVDLHKTLRENMIHRPSELFGSKRNGSGMIVFLFLLCLRIRTAESGGCPGDKEFTLPEGKECMRVDFKVFGKWISSYPWSGSGLNPGVDCFPEGTYSTVYKYGGKTCHHSYTIKANRCGSIYVTGGSRSCSGYDDDVWGSRCTISCNDGYRLYGDSTLTCLESEHWDKQHPTCQELCTWRSTQCWPGDCGNDLTSQCVCRHGFTRRNFYSALCDLSEKPDLNTCRMRVTDSQGTQKDSPTRGDITSCPNQEDTGIRTQPTTLTFTIKAHLDLDLGSNHPAHVLDPGKVGVTGARIDVIKRLNNGTETNVVQKLLNNRPECQETASSTHPVYGSKLHDCEGNVTLPTSLHLTDGESVCADIEVSGGGYYTLQDFHHSPKGTVVFPATHSEKRICFVMDMTKPAHCSQSASPCSSQPLSLSTRTTRRPQVTVTVDGWLDPVPHGGIPQSASGLEKFRLEVHGVDVNRTSLSVQEDAMTSFGQEWEAAEASPGGRHTRLVSLPDEEPRLYALILEVHDKAGNVAYARRLVFVDNSSTVDLMHSERLRVVHANPRSNDRWQTDVSKPLCVDWRGRFHNDKMYHNNFLMSVKTDVARDIHGDYDQTEGLFPVDGTDNVDGIITFEMSWSGGGNPRSNFRQVSDLQAQTTCLAQQLQDGETYNVTIKATDIMDNYKEDSVVVSIDHTGPAVSVEGLRGRWNRTGLYVHNSTDLSAMTLVLTAADPHSGLKSIRWALSTHPMTSDVGEGHVGVQRLDNQTSCSGEDNCYCPAVGVCETDRYLVTFTNLVHNNTHQGDHHREYYVTLTVTNHASLTTTTVVDLLLDESPPTVGVVWEGLSDDGQAEMDFTSTDMVHVRWHGFHDHQSGVSLYRVGLGERCMTALEMEGSDNVTEEEFGNMASLRIPSEGRYYVSVVAYNGALTPSEVACSDGITYDTTPPALLNVSLTHARSGHMLGCTQRGQVWLVNNNLTRVALDSNATGCSAVCPLPVSLHDVTHLPLSSSHVVEEELSDHYCRNLPKMSEDSVIVLPSDYVRMTWQGRDAESEMEEYFIGMGGDRTTSSAPDLLPFTRTHGHVSYHARHVGLGHGDLFFVFLQAQNKAGLNVTLTLGPIVIDVTPPDVTQPLAALLKEGYLLVSWEDNVFNDREQPQGVEFDVTFRVGYTGGFVTPFLTMPQSSLAQCRKHNVTGCARYPITALYAHDTQDGRSFYFQLHVINAAGHVTTVDTSSVRLPAHYPPSHAVVMDVIKTMVPDFDTTTNAPVTTATATETSSTDANTGKSSSTPTIIVTSPATEVEDRKSTDKSNTYPVVAKFSDDVDAIVQRESMCVAWRGLYHEEEISIAAGLGTAPGQDDITSFQLVWNETYYCFNITAVPVYTKVFSVIKATSPGGTTVFSSDGYVMIPNTDPKNRIEVFNGGGCYGNNYVGSQIVEKASTSVNLPRISNTLVHPGDFMFVNVSPFVSGMNFHGAMILQTTLTGYQLVAMTTNITATLPAARTANTTVTVQHCQKDSVVSHLPTDHVTGTWFIDGPWTPFVKYLKAEIMDETCLGSAVKKTKYSHQQCLLHAEKVEAAKRELHIHTNNVINDHRYVTSITPCFDDGCLPSVSSAPITYTSTHTATFSFNQAFLRSVSALALEVEVQATLDQQAGGVPLGNQSCVYQWTVGRDRAGSIPVTDWRVRETSSCSHIQIGESVGHHGNSGGTFFICIRLLYPLRSDVAQCHKLSRSRHTTEFDPFHIIELDHRLFRQTDFEPLLHSLQLGSNLHDLYDFDLDFAKSDIMLSAILTGAANRNVTWFLMTNPHAPSLADCAGDPDCVTSSATQTSHVTFPRHLSKLQHGHVFYICAMMSAEPVATVTPGSETARQLCGDGVVIDDTPPVKGSVTIDNANAGFLANGERVLVTWSGFADVETEVSVLPDDVTLNFSVALGSYPGAEDIAGYVQVGQRTSWTFHHLSVESGVTCVATVRAQDRVGHVTEAASEHVIVDKTPPSVSHVTAGTVTQENFLPGHEVPVYWEGAEDTESGIRMIEVGVTNEGGGDNVIEFGVCEGSSTTLTDTSLLVDGHVYVVLLKVTNRAGLVTLKSSAPFVVDRSPPSPGHMWHSDSNTSTPSGYSREVGVLSVKWAGFTDPHSGLDYFRIGLGSAPNATDIVPFVYVGKQTEYSWRRELDQGTKYYATLQACNRAGLCRVTSSNSVTFDDSPPTAGIVTVGSYGHHSKFLGHTTSVPVQWTGFSDPQTGIQHFTWCVGTLPLLCDVTPSTHTLLSRDAHRAGLALPVATPLYVTVRASNPAGLETVSVSDSFVVDPTPPEVVTRPHFLSPRDGSPIVSQWDRSVLRVAWELRDSDSSVVSHVVYIRSKLTGRLVLDPVTLGADTELTVTLDESSLLADGDSHWVSVTACNAAHLCVTATSDVIIIDSTPPVTGTSLSPLRWSRQVSDVTGDVMTAVEVRWRGFSDAESGVTQYEVMAGRRYNGEELSGGRVRVRHNQTAMTQHVTLEMRGELKAGDVINLALMAHNSVRRHSPFLRMAFTCLHDNHNATSGTLVLVRHSCQADYCTQECTCAARGKLCDDVTAACVELDSSHPLTSRFAVLPYMGQSAGLNMSSSASTQNDNSSLTHNEASSITRPELTTSAKCLEGHWSLVQPQSLVNVSRFEVSFSLANKTAGQGVYDVQREPVWNDVGRDMTVVHCLPGNRTLLSGQRYVMHVRVWMSRDQYVTFISPSIMVDHTPPQVRRGGAVIESDITCIRDLDYVTSQDSDVTVCWAGVFRDSQSDITKYQIWIGTSQFASNHHPVTDVGLNTTWTFPVMHLEPGTRYYVTVRAWNEAGLQTTAVSDGFLTDVTPPVAGVVFASGHHSNRHAQSSTSTLAATWHGFEDKHSGVASYQAAVYDTSDVTMPVMSFRDFGVKTELRLQNLTLQHQHSYVIAVKATDAAGLESRVAKSPAILVDVTPPEGVTCTDFNLQEETTLTPTGAPSVLLATYHADVTGMVREIGEVVRVEVTATGADHSAVGVLHLAELKMPLHFRFSPSGVATAQHQFLSPHAGVLKLRVVVEARPGAVITAKLYNCTNTVVSPEHAVTFRQMSHDSISLCARIRDRESGLQTLMLGVGTTPGGLQVRPWTRVGHGGHMNIDVHVQHATPLYVTAVAENRAGQWSRFTSQLLTFDRTAPFVSDVTLTLRYEDDEEVEVNAVFAEGRWTAEDEESDVEYCTCHLEGEHTDDPAPQKSEPVRDGTCRWQLRDPRHESEVTMSVTCVNRVHLSTTVTSSPVTLLLKPPDVSQVTMDSLSNNALMSPYDRSSPKVRSNNSSLPFFWRGVQDPTVTRLYFRFLQESLPLTEWSPLEVYKTTAILEKRAMSRTGKVTAQLKAVNSRNMTSRVISASVLLDDTSPSLTGQAATASLREDQLHLDWRHVFDVTRDITYSVFAGSEKGFGDVINHVTTTSTSYTGYSSRSTSVVYVIIQAVYDNGLFTAYTGALNIRVE